LHYICNLFAHIMGNTVTGTKVSGDKVAESSDVKIEGFLLRKHTWLITAKKSTDRSWNRVYVVVKDRHIFFYKDQKTYMDDNNVTFKDEAAVQLLVGKADIAHEYTKKKHVFRLRLADGGEYLFVPEDEEPEEQMKLWITVINNQTSPAIKLFLESARKNEE